MNIEQFDEQRDIFNYELNKNFLKIVFNDQKIGKLTEDVCIRDDEINEDHNEDTEINLSSIMQLFEKYQEKKRFYDLITSQDVDMNMLRYRVTYSFYNDVFDEILRVKNPFDELEHDKVTEKLHTKRI